MEQEWLSWWAILLIIHPYSTHGALRDNISDAYRDNRQRLYLDLRLILFFHLLCSPSSAFLLRTSSVAQAGASRDPFSADPSIVTIDVPPPLEAVAEDYQESNGNYC